MKQTSPKVFISRHSVVVRILWWQVYKAISVAHPSHKTQTVESESPHVSALAWMFSPKSVFGKPSDWSCGAYVIINMSHMEHTTSTTGLRFGTEKIHGGPSFFGPRNWFITSEVPDSLPRKIWNSFQLLQLAVGSDVTSTSPKIWFFCWLKEKHYIFTQFEVMALYSTHWDYT